MKFCEIFKTGNHTDASGSSKEWSKNDLDTIVNNFNSNNNSVPVVIGHPKANNPAYAWVDEVKRDGDKLLASFKQVVPEFAEWVNKGLYKNRSISLYPDLKLRHIGFLGAQPPAVKGLEQFQFSENQDALTFDFSAPDNFKFDTIANIFSRLRDFLIDKYDLDTANNIINTWNLEDLKQHIEDDADTAELQAYCESLKDKGKELALANTITNPPAPPATGAKDYSEDLTNANTEIAKLKKQLDDKDAADRKKDFEQFAEQAVKDGNITPAQKSFVVDFCEICSNTGTFDFAEGKEKSALKNFKEFLTGIKQIDFSELPNGNEETSTDFSDPVEIKNAILEYQEDMSKKGINITTAQALDAIKNKK